MEGRNGKSQWRLPDHVPERVNRFVGFVGLQDGVADAICVGTSTTSGESLEMLNGTIMAAQAFESTLTKLAATYDARRVQP